MTWNTETTLSIALLLIAPMIWLTWKSFSAIPVRIKNRNLK
jgi:hypothetical protein